MTSKWIMAFGLMFSFEAFAGWTAVAETPSSRFYSDFSSVTKSGGAVRLWNMASFVAAKQMMGTSYRSAKTFEEYDCGNSKYRTLQRLAYSGKDGEGRVVYSNTDSSDWVYVTPGTIDELLFRLACRGR